MRFHTWLIKIRLVLNSKLNSKKQTNKYVKTKQRRAAEEIKFLKSFTQWPIAKVNKVTQDNKQEQSSIKNTRYVDH